MIDYIEKPRYTVEDLLALVAALRSPGGCPWDGAQTHQSIRRNLLEEAYEVCEAIDQQSPAHLQEELGDLLLQVVFHICLAQEEGAFTLEDVTTAICQKLIDRHPHLFGRSAGPGDWEALKQAQRGNQTTTQAMEQVCRALPGLWRAEKLLGKAEKAGYDVTNYGECLWQKPPALDTFPEGQREQALGRLLFAAVLAARRFGIDPERAIQGACEDFLAQFSSWETQTTALADKKERGILP